MKRLLVMLLVTALLLPSFAVSAVDTLNPFSYLDEQRLRLIEGASLPFTDAPVFLSESSDELSLNRCIVKFSASLSMKKIYSIVSGYDFELLADSSQRLFLLYVESADAFAMEHAGVTDYIETDAVRGLEAFNDTYYSKQWQYEMYDFDAIWSISSGGSGVTVAVIDSGINRNHEDLIGANILSGYNAVTDTLSVTADTIGHGTAVAGIIAAPQNNSKGVAGICSGAALLPVAVTRANGEIYSADFIKALYFAADSGADIINMSFAGSESLSSEKSAIDYANNKGCILIGASGNYDSESVERGEYSYPASYEHVISVASFGSSGALSHFSCYNDMVDIAAPGEDIYVIYGTTNTAVLIENGTSFAVPFVSAVAALALSVKQSDVEVSSDAFASLLAATASASTSAPCGNINPAAVISAINDPIVTGIVDGGVYFSNVTVSFNLGLATLDGEMFASGTTIKVNGTHTLVITYGDTVSEYNFTTDNLPLTYSCPSGNSYSMPICITFTRGTATLNGTPYYSGKQISKSGYYTFILTGPNGNTVEKTFAMHTDLPILYGAENGAVYTHAVELSIIGDGTATVGSKTIKNGETMLISDSGNYTVTLRNVGGTQTKAVTFTVYNEPDAGAQLELFNALVAVDADNSNVYVYGTSLYGVRIYDAQSPGTMLRYVTTGEKTVLKCVVSGSKTALMHSSSISLMDGARMRSGEPLRGTVQGSGTFTAIATDSSALYALLVSGGETKLVKINTTLFRTETLMTFSGTYNSLVWAQAAGVFVITDGSGKLIKYDPSANTADTLSGYAEGDVFYTDGALYIGGSIYDSAFRRIAVVPESSGAIAAFEGMLIYTDTAVDALTGETLGRLSDSVIAAACGGGSVYLLYSDAVLSKYTFDSTAQSLGCTEISNVLIGDSSSISDFSSLTSAESGAVIADWVHSETLGKLYIILEKSNYLYILDDDFSSQQAVWINERPTALTILGSSLYIGLEDSARMAIYNGNNGTVIYMSLTEPLAPDSLTAAQDALFCLSQGNVYFINVGDGTVVTVTSTGQCTAIAYDSPSCMLYCTLENDSGATIEKYDGITFNLVTSGSCNNTPETLVCDSTYVYAGNVLYNAQTLETADIMTGNVLSETNGFLLTDDGIYDLYTRSMVVTHGYTANKTLLSEGFELYYYIEGTGFVKLINDAHTSPSEKPEITLSGTVVSNGVYEGAVTVSFEFGNGYVDGYEVDSGSSVSDGGTHTLTVILPFGISVIRTFTVTPVLSGIRLSGPSSISVNSYSHLTLTFLPFGVAELPVVFTVSDLCLYVDKSGGVYGLSEGTAVITASTEDGRFTSQLTVTVTAYELKFTNSRFTLSSDKTCVVNVAAGTTVSSFLSYVSYGTGTASVTDAQGTELTGKMILKSGHLLNISNSSGLIMQVGIAVRGDADGDGYVTPADLVVTNKHTSGKIVLTGACFYAADATLDGKVNLSDMLLISSSLIKKSSLTAQTPSPAAGDGSVSISLGSLLTPGENVTFRIMLDASESYAFSGTLEYDGDALEFVSARAAGKWTAAVNQVTNKLYFAAYDEKLKYPITGKSNVIAVTFRAADMLDDNDTLTLSVTDAMTDGGSAAGSELTCKVKSKEKTLQLESLEITNDDVELAFCPGTLSYWLTVSEDVEKLDLIAVCADGNAEITTSDTSLTPGVTTAIYITVSDGDLETVYTLYVKREIYTKPNNDARIKAITLSGGVLSPDFSPDIFEYELITSDLQSVNISVTPMDDECLCSVSGTDDAIEIFCVAADGTTLTYILTAAAPSEESCSDAASEAESAAVSTDESVAETDSFCYIVGGVMLLGILLVTAALIIIFRKKKKNAQKDTQPEDVH